MLSFQFLTSDTIHTYIQKPSSPSYVVSEFGDIGVLGDHPLVGMHSSAHQGI